MFSRTAVKATLHNTCYPSSSIVVLPTPSPLISLTGPPAPITPRQFPASSVYSSQHHRDPATLFPRMLLKASRLMQIYAYVLDLAALRPGRLTLTFRSLTLFSKYKSICHSQANNRRLFDFLEYFSSRTFAPLNILILNIL